MMSTGEAVEQTVKLARKNSEDKFCLPKYRKKWKELAERISTEYRVTLDPQSPAEARKESVSFLLSVGIEV